MAKPYEYETVDVLTATVTTLVPYADDPEVRSYTVHSEEELRDLVLDMQNPQHTEEIIDVSIIPDDGHNELVNES